MNVLITGITGFVGSHLAEYLLTMPDVKVHGMLRWRSKTENIEHLKNKIEFVECDLRDATSVEKAIEVCKPDKIFHLAAQSFVPTSWHAPQETLTTNIVGQLNIFEACRNLGLNPWIQIACSSEEYGMVKPDETPIKETNPLRPLSPYAVSKVGQDFLGYQYFASYGLKIVRTRGFNHTGPRRGDVFVESTFSKQIAEIEKGKKEPFIDHGNLDAIRDYTDVRDMVRAYWLATEKCEPGEVYNICTGSAWKIQDMLNYLLSKSKVKVTLRQDPKRMRPSDVQVLIGDNSKFRKATGWEPKYKFEQTLDDLLDYWRSRV
jgi:GDP-4-dehydro-6-deoxy-D-mannose reductase